jgi:hypothetical protein
LAWLRAMGASDGNADKAAAMAEVAYEGGASNAWPEGREACLRRTYPSFEDLAADPNFADDTRRLYGHLLDALPGQLYIRPLPESAQEVARD